MQYKSGIMFTYCLIGLKFVLTLRHFFLLYRKSYFFCFYNLTLPPFSVLIMMTMNCFSEMVDWQKGFTFRKFSPSQASYKSATRFQPTQNLSSGFIEWSSVLVITATPRHHWFDDWFLKQSALRQKKLFMFL